MNDYYDVKIKNDRLKRLEKYKVYLCHEDISNYKTLNKIFKEFGPNMVVNLAAQAGVRHSIKNPVFMLKPMSKVFMNILECCKI